MKYHDTYRGEVIGKWPRRRQWYSYCSTHRFVEPDCTTCNLGHYVYDIDHWIEHQFYVYARPLWLWWVNRPNSKSRKRLEEAFPRLKQQ